MKWYKMYVNSIRDIKFRKLQKKNQGAFSHYWTLWCMILDEASSGGGVISVTLEDWDLMFDLIADQTSTDELHNMIVELQSVGLIHLSDQDITVTNWEKYQVGVDRSTDRVIKHREEKKNDSKITEVVQMFNQITDSRYSDKTKATREAINARLEEGRTMEEIRAVIIDRQKVWSGDQNMSKYITPSTIFRPAHFEKYLNAIPKDKIDAANDGTLIKVRDMYQNVKHVTQTEFDNASQGFYTKID